MGRNLARASQWNRHRESVNLVTAAELIEALQKLPPDTQVMMMSNNEAKRIRSMTGPFTVVHDGIPIFQRAYLHDGS